MSAQINLAAEWERIDLLGACLSIHRSGGSIGDEVKDRLNYLQQTIQQLRHAPPWLLLNEQWRLNSLDQDILAFTVAPEAEPRLGWMFQELQPGIATAYPSAALIREMLFLEENEASEFNQRLQRHAPLIAGGLLDAANGDSFQPLHPTPLAMQQLLGWDDRLAAAPPGAVAIPITAAWDDLVLPEQSLHALHEYLYWITHRQRVVDEWGGRGVGGPVALFAGPSGTGKTYAAEVLANALAWPLYRVDLGLLVSKYIGETEKNFNALFEAAHGRSMVLLFDEADSLFGKRGEVKDARDRYANMEVSHLLSRIERHQGPCILTTNLRQHIDTAFARRFQTVIEFSRPDTPARKKLWQKHLPPKAPFAADLDLDVMAAAVSFTGGQIRNAALQAAYLAAAEDAAIGMRQIARAAFLELSKSGREVTRAGMGELASHLSGEVE